MPVILPSEAKKTRKPVRMLRPSKVSRAARKNYLDALADQVKFLKGATANLSDLMRKGATRQEAAAMLREMSAQATARVAAAGPDVAKSFVDEVSKQNKASIERNIASALSVDFAAIVDTADTAAELSMAVTRNTALIRSIPEQHLFDVAQAVMDNYAGRPLPGDVSLTQRLQQIGGISEDRAKFIARDQTAKLTGALNASRQQSNGIEEYKWRNSGDERVVGNPSGLYPKGSRRHGDHWDREGKTYRWDTPPADGNPGEPIQCRCWAEPILDLAKLAAQYV